MEKSDFYWNFTIDKSIHLHKVSLFLVDKFRLFQPSVVNGIYYFIFNS